MRPTAILATTAILARSMTFVLTELAAANRPVRTDWFAILMVRPANVRAGNIFVVRSAFRIVLRANVLLRALAMTGMPAPPATFAISSIIPARPARP